MFYRYVFVTFCSLTLFACGGGSNSGDDGAGKTPMAGYKMPDSIEILQVEE